MLIPTRPAGSSAEPSEPAQRPRRRKRSPGSSASPAAPKVPTSRRHAFDIARDLADNCVQYAGTEWVTLNAVPAFIRTCLDRIRSRAGDLSSTRPGLSPTLSCCMMYGLQLIAAHPEVRSMLEMKTRLDALNSGEVDAEDVDELAGWFRSFPLSVPDDRMVGVRRLNATLPGQVKQMLYDLSGELGAAAGTLAVIAVGVGLQTQASMLEGHRESLDRIADVFYRRVARRRRVAEGLLAEALEHGHGDPGGDAGEGAEDDEG